MAILRVGVHKGQKSINDWFIQLHSFPFYQAISMLIQSSWLKPTRISRGLSSTQFIFKISDIKQQLRKKKFRKGRLSPIDKVEEVVKEGYTSGSIPILTNNSLSTQYSVAKQLSLAIIMCSTTSLSIEPKNAG